MGLKAASESGPWPACSINRRDVGCEDLTLSGSSTVTASNRGDRGLL